MHLVCDASGNGLGVIVTPGQRHESVVFEAVMDTVEVRRQSGQSKRRPLRLAGDKACSNRRIRRWLARRKIKAVIARPDDQRARLSERAEGAFDREQYRRRNVVERLIGRLKECRRIATRYEKLAVNFLAMLKLALIALYLE
jgi:transposase